MVKINGTVAQLEVTQESNSQSRRNRNAMALKKYRYHKKITLENLQKKADLLETRYKQLVEQRDRLMCESEALVNIVKTHARSCSGIIQAMLEYTIEN